MTKLDAGLMTSLPASDPGSAAVWGSKRINPRPQFCLCLAWSGWPSNDDDDFSYNVKLFLDKVFYIFIAFVNLFLDQSLPSYQLKIK